MARPVWRGQIQCLGQGNEPDPQVLQFLESCWQIPYGPAPAVQAPNQHQVARLALLSPALLAALLRS